MNQNILETIGILLIISVLLITTRCFENKQVLNAQYSVYKYSAYDSTGTKIVTGWFKLNFQDSSAVNGNWAFQKIDDPQDIGPQVEEGDLIGSIADSNQISINLNPQWKDNNVFLNGVMTQNEINGRWIWVSFIGETNSGTFHARH